MKSNFSSTPKRRVTSSSVSIPDETYDLKLLNQVAPDQVMPAGETPFTINTRRFADDEDETSVAIRTRNGSARLSTPVGEAITVQNTNTITKDILIDTTRRVGVPFVAGGTGILTRFAATLKKLQNTRGYVIVEIYTSNIGLPGVLVGQSSIAPSFITGTYASVDSYFIDAPDLVNGQTYFAVFSMQDLGVGAYYLGGTTAGTSQVSINGGKTWVAESGLANFKAYKSDAGFIKGFTKRYPQDGGGTQDRTVFAMGTKVYEVPNSPAVPTTLDSTVDASSTIVDFTFKGEQLIFTDGISKPKISTAVGVAPTVITAAKVQASLPVYYQNRLFYVPGEEPNRIDFSALNDPLTYNTVDFLIVGRPDSPDIITEIIPFQENLTVFTKGTKYTYTGSSVQSLFPIAHEGTLGAISRAAVAKGAGTLFFMAADRNIYRWNGVKDTLISFRVGPELKKILDLDKVRFHFHKNQLRVYYNKNPDANVTHMLLYDVDQDQWAHDTGRPVMGSMDWLYNENELIEFSGRGGVFYAGETGYSDLGKAIDFKYWTAYKMYNSGASKKRVKKFRPVVRPADSAYYLLVGKDMDHANRPDMRKYLVDAGGAKWGTFNWNDGTTYGGSSLIDNLAPMSGRGKFVQYRFEHKGIDQPVDLYGYIAIVKAGPRR